MLSGTSRLLRTAALLGVAAMPFAPARAQDPVGDVVSVRLEWEPGAVGGITSRSIELKSEMPAGVKPPVGIKRPRYVQRKVAGDKLLTFVFETEPGAERVWVDRNLDGDLSDDRYGRWEKSGSTLSRSETVLVPYAGERQPVPAEIYLSKPGSADKITFYAKLHRVGSVVLGGRVRKIAVKDVDHDLKFDCKVDVIVLDLDGDGRLASGTDSHEEFLQGAAFRIGDQGWTAKVTDVAGTAVELTKTSEPPPRVPRKWRRKGNVSSNYRPSPPTDSLADLFARFAQDESKPYAQRHQTVTDIGRHGTDEAFEALRRIAEDDREANLRAAAVRAMGNANFVAHGETVAKYTKSKTTNIAQGAIQSLHKMGYEERKGIYLALLGSGVAQIAGEAAKHLALLDDPDAQKAAIDACRSFSQDNARYYAYQGLRALADGPPRDLMLEMARGSYAPLTAMALQDLHALDHPDTRKLALEAAPNRPVQIALGRALCEILGAHGDKESAEVLLTLAIEGPDSLRTDIVRQLGALRGEAAVKVFIGALSAKDPKIRALAAQILGGIPVRDATAALLKRLRREKDEDAAIAQLEALGDHGDPAAVELLLKAAKKKGVLRQTAIRALARLGFGLPEVRKYLLKLLTAKAFGDRILAVDAAAASGDLALGRKLIPNLSHDRWQLRLAVVEALRKLRSPDWVEPLIEQLEREEEQRVRSAIGVTLFELTGTNLYDEPALWRQWYTDNGSRFTMPEAIPTLPRTDPGGTRGGFYGIPVDSDRVIFVIDQSGSMSAMDATTDEDSGKRKNRLDVAVAEVVKAIGQLGTRSRANVIFFHTTIHPWKDELTKLSGANRKALEKHLLRQRPTGGTNIYDGLERALADDEVDTLLFLSDGVPGAGKYTTTADILRGVKRLNQTRRISIHCVSLGRDSDLLKRLAEENGGEYVRR